MRSFFSQWSGTIFLLFFCVCAQPACSSGSADIAVRDVTGECVVLLHGLGRTSTSMNDMGDALEEKGYLVANIDYPSRDYPIEVLAPRVVGEGIRQCSREDVRVIHFATHSLGGILVRYYFEHNVLKELGRVVMLSPPNLGSEVTDELADNFFYKNFFGEAGLQLGTGPESLVMQLGPVTYPAGVITGNEHAFFDAWFSRLIPGEDDGKVSIKRARVEGMTDFIVLPYSHPFIMEEDEVISQTIHFLQHGEFLHGSVDSPSEK